MVIFSSEKDERKQFALEVSLEFVLLGVNESLPGFAWFCSGLPPNCLFIMRLTHCTFPSALSRALGFFIMAAFQPADIVCGLEKNHDFLLRFFFFFCEIILKVLLMCS